MDFLEEKTKAIDKLNLYISLCSNLDTPNLEYINGLNSFLNRIKIANKTEFKALTPLLSIIIGNSLEQYQEELI